LVFWTKSGGAGLRFLASMPGKIRIRKSRLVEQPWVKGDPDPKAFACYGVLWQQGPVADPIRKQMSLRFVTGRPVSAITTQFLTWCCQRLQAQSNTRLSAHLG